jgi:hypothetical protein
MGTIGILMYATDAPDAPLPVGVCGYCACRRELAAMASRDRGAFVEEADVCAPCLTQKGQAYLCREFFPQRWQGKTEKIKKVEWAE